MNLLQAQRMNRRTTMAIIAQEKGGKDFKKVPPGAHFAICNMVVDCGVQDISFKGKAKQQHKVYVRWEVPDERVSWEKDGKAHEGPCSIGRFYTLSLSEKAILRKDLENWRGRMFTEDELKGFDLETILGKPCQIMVTHSDDGKYANINGIMGLSKDQRERGRTAKAENPLVSFSLATATDADFKKLPEWLQEKINDRAEPQDIKPAPAQAHDVDDFDDPLPF
jgi:hypothetical protein